MRRLISAALAILVLAAAPAAAQAPAAGGVEYPAGSRIGLKPPAGMTASNSFPGFENREREAFIRLVALPDKAFAEIEKTMTAEALKTQGLNLIRRESAQVGGARGFIVQARQDTPAGRIRKWLLIAPLDDLTALISFEMPDRGKPAYTDAAIRSALLTAAARAKVPEAEQLSLLPFRLGDMAGFRLVGVIPGRAAQLTDGPKDTVDQVDQPHIIIGIAPGTPRSPDERDSFARAAFGGLPNLKDVRIIGSESMRLGGQPGHEIRAQAKDATSGAEVEVVQWIRFGGGAYVRILAFAPKDGWTENFSRFRSVREGVEPR